MEGSLRKARMTVEDLRGKLREANVLERAEVRAVVLETTGDVSVLHGGSGRDVDGWLLEGVRRAEATELPPERTPPPYESER